MDTFNFSFFEDKPEGAPHTPAEAAASTHFESAQSEPTPAPASSAKDPFDLADFDFAGDPIAGDPIAGDPIAGDPIAGDPIAGDPIAGDPIAGDPLVSDAFSLDELGTRVHSSSTLLEEDALELDPNAHLAASEALDPLSFAEFPDLAATPGVGDALDLDPLAFDVSSPSPGSAEAPTAAPALEAPSPLSLETPPSFAPNLSVEPAQEPTFSSPAVAQAAMAPASNPTISEPPRRRYLTQDEPYGEVAPRRDRLRVAVLGASGIGFNHALWLDKHAGEIVGFLGSSEETVAETAQKLEAELGHAVPGFSDLGVLLSQTQPQAVCIASPPALHFGQALACLEAGAHVLCEKPLVYIAGRSKRENRDGARELLKTATKKQLVLATQLQYGAATPILCRLAGVTPFEVGDFAMEIETLNPRASRDPKELWIDLGPHPLSVAQFLAGENAELVEETLQVLPQSSDSGAEVSVRFGVRCEGGRLLMCRAIVRALTTGSEARRRFAFNGRIVQYNGVRMTDGTYIAQYISPDGYISHYPDPVDFLTGNFVHSCWGDDQLVISAAQGVQNLDWLLTIADKI